jgi:phosphoribosylglycinamide formyltransferase-1
MTFPIAVLISGKGSNLAAILDAIAEGRCPAEVRCVVSDRDTAEGLHLARARAIPCVVVKPKDYPSREQWDHALGAAVASHDPALVVLAGFMRLVGSPVIARFRSRLINVHPSLLPLFPGTNAPEQALAARVRVSGCSVHMVDSGVDTGPIIAQAVVPVLVDDDAESLHGRIQRAEHRLLPAVIDAIARGTIVLGADGCSVPRIDCDSAMLCSPPLCGEPQ